MFQYPEAPRDDTILDTFHKSHTVKDPFRPLEDPDSPATTKWVQAQNELTSSFLSVCPFRQQLQSSFQQTFNYPRYSCPSKHADNFFFFKNDGLQNQSVLYKQTSLTAEPTVLLDPNTIEKDGTASLGAMAFSEDGAWLAYGVSRSGSDWQCISVLSVATGERLPQDDLKWVKFSGISWTHDNKGFFYSRYPTPSSLSSPSSSSSSSPAADESKIGAETDSMKDQTVYYHRLGTSQDQDVIVLDLPEQPLWMTTAEVSDDGQYVLFSIADSCDPKNRLFYCRLDDNKQLPLPTPSSSQSSGTSSTPVRAAVKVCKLIDTFDLGQFNYVTNVGSRFYFLTNHRAPRYKIIVIDLEQPIDPSNWRDVIPHADTSRDVLTSVYCVANNYLLVTYLRDVVDVLQLYDLNGKCVVPSFPTPSIGSITSVSAKKKHQFFFYHFSSFLYPGTIYHADLSSLIPSESSASSTSTSASSSPTSSLSSSAPPIEMNGCVIRVFRETVVPGFNASQFRTEQVWYESKDGTRIPMFIVKPADAILNGDLPCYLYGYGGFNISNTPSFSVSVILFLKHFRGVYALPNIRGGGEYGEEWHNAGKLLNKQNVFDDFIAAATFLVQHKYTNPSKLVISGGSNGGLLVGACVNQRPALFGAAVAAVGVLDMLRFHKFTIGYAWCSDYGNPDTDEAQFLNLLKYSPLHTVPTDTTFPALLLTTADHDDRVSPLHSYKYIAQVQAVVGQNEKQTAPLLIRVDVKAGHGGGKPLSKRIEEAVDVFAFMQQALNVTLHVE